MVSDTKQRELERFFFGRILAGKQFYWVIVGLLFLTYIICALNLPVSIYTLAGHDDALFWSRALKIIQGDWLGDYNQMTLSKGPTFSVFLAVNAVIGVPVTLSVALLYFFSCFIFIRAISQLGVSQWVTLVLLTILLFNPELFPTRVIRDVIYPALTLLIVAGIIRAAYLNTHWLILAGYGLCLGLFWLLREEGVWIVPGFLFGVALPLVLLAMKQDWRTLKVRSISLASFIGTGTFVVLLVSLLNYHHYGIFASVDFKEHYFKKSLKVLNSIEVDTEISHVPVQFEKRMLAYEFSPTFLTLKKYFEEEGKNWTNPGCNIYKWTCGDYAGGWFMWAYRDGVAGLGHYSSADDAREFYKRVYLEISEACSSGDLRCRANVLPFLPRMTIEQLWQIPEQFLKAILLLNNQNDVSLDAGPSMGPLDLLQKVRKFLRQPYSSLAVEEDEYHINGWFYDQKDKWPQLECEARLNEIRKIDIERQSSPDIASSTKDELASRQRFSLWLTGAKTCRFVYEDDALEIATISDEENYAHKLGQSGTIYIESLKKVPDLQRQVAESIKNTLVKIYKVISPLLFVAGILALVVYLIWPISLKHKITPLFSLAITLWILVIARVFLLVLIEVTSFPAINSLYMNSAYPLFSSVCILSICLVSNLINPIKPFNVGS